jgi:hypothetical protein
VPSAGVLAGLVVALLEVALLAAAVAAAAPAAAIDDPTRPDARVTHGPSCRPGGLVVEVQAGTTPYSVRLATTRQPAGEAEALLAAGEFTVLRSGEVAWGETIDGRLEYAAQDGSGLTYVDELEDYSFTRPTQEDCAAVTAPASPEPGAPGSPSSAPVPTPTAGADGGDAASAPPAPDRSGGPTATPTADQRPGPAAPSTGDDTGRDPTRATSTASASRVPAGSTVTLRARGFLPGERVTILMHAGGAVIGSAVAGDDGTVEAEVQIPSGTALGPARLDLVGDSSATVTNLELQVAAEEAAMSPRGTVPLGSLVAAAVALVASVAGLVSVAGRQRAVDRFARQRRTA